MSIARPFITPTYQSNLNAAIHEVIERLNTGRELSWQTWEALKTLYYTIPPKCQAKCETDFSKIEDYVERRTASITDHGLFARSKEWQEIIAFLYERNWKFYASLMKALGPYLDIKPREIPKGVQKGLEAAPQISSQ